MTEATQPVASEERDRPVTERAETRPLPGHLVFPVPVCPWPSLSRPRLVLCWAQHGGWGLGTQGGQLSCSLGPVRMTSWGGHRVSWERIGRGL